jgi:N6-adenosine-specific RNA methylase IME4
MTDADQAARIQELAAAGKGYRSIAAELELGDNGRHLVRRTLDNAKKGRMTQTLPPGHAELQLHPFCRLFPPMSGPEQQALGDSLQENGQRHPILLHRGMVLDGRHRYQQLLRLGIAVRAEVFAGDDRAALQLVLDENLHRRHLTESQRGLIAARIAELRLGDNQHSRPAPAPIGAPGFAFDAPKPEPQKRTTWPAGHTVTMKREYPADGDPLSIGTCQCGAVFRYPLAQHIVQDAAIEAHWAEVDQATESQSEPAPIGATVEPPAPVLSQTEAAAAMNVGRRTVQRGAEVISKGAPELQAAVESGQVKLGAAAEIAQMPIERQREIIASADPKAVKQVAKEYSQQRAKEKQERRAELERDLGAKIAAEPPLPQIVLGDDLSIGRAGEHIVCADALTQGWNAFLAGQGTPYDVVIERAGRIFRIQVKTARSHGNVNSQGKNERLAYNFAVARRGKEGRSRLSSREAEIVACVALDIKAIAYFPTDECPQTIQLERGPVEASNYVRTYTRPITEYPLDEAIERLAAAGAYHDLQKVFPAFPRRRFGVLYADCPWSFGTWSEAGMDRSADNHYPTVPTDVLCGIGPYIPATDDAVVFLWATSPMLTDAIRVMSAWGFDYKSCLCWRKSKVGTGYWFRNAHELLLIGTRGNVPAPAMGTQWESVLESPSGRHSAKPDAVYEMIEAYFPTVPRIELYARGSARANWAVWGNQANDVPEPVEAALSAGPEEMASESAAPEADLLSPAGRATAEALSADDAPEDFDDDSDITEEFMSDLSEEIAAARDAPEQSFDPSEMDNEAAEAAADARREEAA